MKSEKNQDPFAGKIGKDMLEQPSDHFTASVMDKLGVESPAIAERYLRPAITKTGWFFIAITCLVIVYLAWPSASDYPSGSSLDQVNLYLMKTTTLFDQVVSGSTFLLMALISVAILVLALADSWYRKFRMLSA